MLIVRGWRILDNKKSQFIVFGSIFFMSMILAITTGSSGYTSSNAYDSGYDHGCDDAGISDPDDRYINQPERGPAFHTGTFMRGYNDGFDACSGNNRSDNGGSSEDECDDVGGSSGGSGYDLTVQVSDWPFGSSSVRINIETANGYTDSSSVNTAVSGTPSLTFNIPQNQGNSVFVCADPEGILAIGNCDTYITNGRDSTVAISAR
jgi:hypothetical protein